MRRQCGERTPDEPGTLPLTVGGSAARAAVVEVPAGMPLGTVLDICEARMQAGVLVGGYHGAWLPAEVAYDVPVSRAGLEAAGGTLGAGVVLPLVAGTCPLGEVARWCATWPPNPPVSAVRANSAAPPGPSSPPPVRWSAAVGALSRADKGARLDAARRRDPSRALPLPATLGGPEARRSCR